MDKSTRNSAIAAAVILLGFGIAAHYLPRLIIALGEVSPFLGGAVAVAFVAAFFLVFYLRGKFRGG